MSVVVWMWCVLHRLSLGWALRWGLPGGSASSEGGLRLARPSFLSPLCFLIVKQCDKPSFCSGHALSVMLVCSPLHCLPEELPLLCFQLVIGHEQSNSFNVFLCDAEFYGSSVSKVYRMREWPGKYQFCLLLRQRLKEKRTNNRAKK